MDQSPVKRDEQYPLLKSDGGGDTNRHLQNSTVVTPAWDVTCVSKQTWCSRWPEFLSACWMTMILLVTSFLVFYALGMSVYRRQSIVIFRCNSTKPAGNVYYHYIVPEEMNIPFKRYSNYMSYMATRYPSLRFQLYFLMDDSGQNITKAPNQTTFLKRLIPQISRTFNAIMDQNSLRNIREFQRKYQNFNITVLYLSKYMSMTPLKFKWRLIPRNYLPFYARVYEILRNGGIGLDLLTYNDQFNALKRIDTRSDSIFKQHNDGINLEKYAEMINELDNEEDQENNRLMSMVLETINNFIYQSSHFFHSDMTSDLKMLDSKPIIRRHRSKRFSDTIINNNNNISDNEFENNQKEIEQDIAENTMLNDTLNNITQTFKLPLKEVLNVTRDTEKYQISVNDSANVDKNITNNDEILNDVANNSVIVKDSKISYIDLPMTFVPQYYFRYDISRFIDDAQPIVPEMSIKSEQDFQNPFYIRSNKNYLTLNPDGSFIAASSRNHPFLLQLISSVCIKINPSIAIRETFRKHCSKIIFNDSYCDFLRISYNL